MEHSQQTLSPEILAEQKAYKASKDSFRAAIKELAEQQVLLKNQRKTVNRDTSMDFVHIPSFMSEQSVHMSNRTKLRHLHIAYAVFRGKDLPEVNSPEHRWEYKNGKLLKTQKIWHKGSTPSVALVEKYLEEHVTKVIHPFKA